MPGKLTGSSPTTTAKMKCGAVIVAAGRGERLKNTTPKAFIPLRSKPLCQYSLDAFLSYPKITDIVLVIPEEKLSSFSDPKFKVVAGGASRQESVFKGLSALECDTAWVFVHDAARPLLTADLLDRLWESAKNGKNCIAAWPISDTVKLAQNTTIAKTLDRQNLWGAQTPQVFLTSVLKDAYAKAKKDNFTGTDEASLVERLGASVELVVGDPWNLKITTPQDLKLAELILENKL